MRKILRKNIKNREKQEIQSMYAFPYFNYKYKNYLTRMKSDLI